MVGREKPASSEANQSVLSLEIATSGICSGQKSPVAVVPSYVAGKG